MDDLQRTVTAALEEASQAGSSPEEILPLVYDELRRLAGGFLARERGGHTLQPTAVVHEAYLRLVDQSRVDWQSRSHFLAMSATMMRRILVDHARRRDRGKRGGDWRRITIEGLEVPSVGDDLDLDQMLDLDSALTKLSDLDPRQARIVELRFFAGCTNDEIAELLGVSKRTVVGHWSHARAWLRRELASAAAACEGTSPR